MADRMPSSSLPLASPIIPVTGGEVYRASLFNECLITHSSREIFLGLCHSIPKSGKASIAEAVRL